MNKLRVLGVLVALAGIFTTFYDTKLTGAVIGLPEVALIKVGGIVILIAGLALFASSENIETYRERESRLQSHLGSRYESLSEKEKHTYNRSLRKYESRIGKEKAYHEALERVVIRTPYFEKSIKGHDIKAIERTIEKIGTGKGKEELLKHDRHKSIRVSKGGRITFDVEENGEIVLREYHPQHY